TCVRVDGSKASFRFFQLKLFLRTNNWSSGHRIRADLWKEICSNPTDKSASFASLIGDQANLGCSVTPVFLTAPGVLLCDYQLNETGRLTLIQLLTAIEHARPDFTYIPILYPLCALFLHYMSDRDAFVCTMSLLSQSQKFLIQTDISVSAARRTLLILLRKHRKVYNLIERLMGSSDDATLIRVFKYLPFICNHYSFKVRVLDCFLFEGQKILYRVAISILVLWQREKGIYVQILNSLFLPISSAKELRDKTASDISAFCSTMKFSPWSTAFHLNMSYIRRIQEENEMKLRKKDATLAEVASSQNLKSLLAEHHYFSVISLLISWIPTRYHLVTPQKLFSVVEDGRSFTTLWSKIEDCYPTVLLIQTTWKQIFGAFCSEAWVMRKRLSKLSYFGTGESFLFQFTPKAACFSWVGLEKTKVSHGEELFQCADATTLIVGLSIRQTLERGSTNHCDTFNNPPLVPERDFEIEAFEVFGFSAEVE
ncbi:RabGAP-TBC and TLD domain containing protein, partial [Trichuris trichiura]